MFVQKPYRKFSLRSFLVGTVSATALVCSAATVQAQDLLIDIEKQSLAGAVTELSKKANIVIVAPAELLAGRHIQPLLGRMSVEDALDQLLWGTNLKFSRENNNTYVVTQRAGFQKISYTTDADYEENFGVYAGDEEQDDDTVGFEEITVTAQKKEQALIDVPISMQVFGAAEIEMKRIEAVEDFLLTVANVSISILSEGPQVSIRGINSGGVGGNYAAMGATLDGVSYSITEPAFLLSSRLVDVERIEVLRGPQGTIAGRNAMAGMVNIISAKPNTDAFEMKGTLDYGRFDSLMAKVVLNVPLSDTFAIRTVTFMKQGGGAVRNVGPAGGSSDRDDYGGRVALRWQPSERLTIDASFGYESLEQKLWEVLPEDVYFSDAQRADRIADLTSWGGDYFDQDFFTDSGIGNNGGTIQFDAPSNHRTTNLTASFAVAYDMEGHTLHVLAGHYENTFFDSFDCDRTEFASCKGSFRDIVETDSIEFRINSDYDGPVNWVGGVTYAEETNGFDGYTVYDGDPATGLYTFAFSGIGTSNLSSLGVFGNVFWDITDRLHLSAGLRMSVEKNAFFSNVFTGDEAEIPNLAFDPDNVIRSNHTEFSPRVTLNYDVAENASAYVQFATGFRNGYNNDARAVGQHLTGHGIVDIPAFVNAEHMKNFEVGLKGRFLDNRLSVAASAFYMDYTDLQVGGGYTLDTADYIYFDINAGEATIKGFELEAAAYITDELEVRANLGYVDTQIEVVYYGTTIGNAGDDVGIPNTKPWTISLSGIYTRDLGDDLKLNARVDYLHRSDSFEGFGKVEADHNPAFTTVDLSLGVSSDSWGVSTYITNAFNSAYWLTTSTGGSRRGTYVHFIPRTFGIRLTYKYGG